jgi:beta-glucosidase
MNRNKPWGSMGSPAHAAAAKKIAEEGIVLLKNDKNTLPIDLNKTDKIAVIGENAIKMMTVGGGSSSLKALYEISPLDGIRNRVGDAAEVVYARGYVGDASGSYNGVVTGQDLEDDRSSEELTQEALEVAKDADVVIFVGGLNKSQNQDSEGADRLSLDLPYNQDELIQKLAVTNKNLVVVNISGNAVAMPWVNEVPAIVQGWFLGSETGNALASVLVGDANPSGKLPFTFPVELTDNSAHSIGEFPGEGGQVHYKESIFVGYRWQEKENIEPLFSFGHGLSYTTFKYGKVSADKNEMTPDGKITFTVDVTNSGKRQGAEIVQLYIRDVKSSLPRPVKELKAFEKVTLQPGETKTVTFTIDKSALSFFDAEKHEWIAESGDFEAIVGASASDVKGKTAFVLK